VKFVGLSSLLLLAVISHAQNPPIKRTLGFQWNWRDAQYLSGLQMVGTSKDISTEDRALLLNALTPQYKEYPDPRKRAAETSLKVVDLNGDGVPEVICQPRGVGFCSPTGNCPFWVFQKTSLGYKLVLQKGSVQNFTIQPTRTNGYLDLVLGTHGSATEQTLYVYRFRDGRYRRTDCYDADWRYLGKDGEYHDSKEPQITPCHN
jgi:hypothetical protein